MKSNNLEYINHFFDQAMDIFPIAYSYISADVPSGFMAMFPAFIFLMLSRTLNLCFFILALSFSCCLCKAWSVLKGDDASKVQSHWWHFNYVPQPINTNV